MLSFRWFIYYCMMFGGVAAYFGWVLGRVPPIEDGVLQTAVKGLFLGLVLAVVLTLLDTLWNQSGDVGMAAVRVLVGGGIGMVGGFLGGLIGQLLFRFTQWSPFVVFGWTLTGLLIGMAPGGFDLLVALARDKGVRGSSRKVINGLIGGTVGGLLGGIFYLLLLVGWGMVFRGGTEGLWSPSATGFVVLGMCIGLMIALAQVVLMEAWLRVEEGFRAGRELILSKGETVIGRAEGCDVGLFGDSAVARTHARIRQQGDRYYLEDNGTEGGTFLNDERIHEPALLRAGDRIRVGRAVLRFGERAKKEQDRRR